MKILVGDKCLGIATWLEQHRAATGEESFIGVLSSWLEGLDHALDAFCQFFASAVFIKRRGSLDLSPFADGHVRRLNGMRLQCILQMFTGNAHAFGGPSGGQGTDSEDSPDREIDVSPPPLPPAPAEEYRTDPRF